MPDPRRLTVPGRRHAPEDPRPPRHRASRVPATKAVSHPAQITAPSHAPHRPICTRRGRRTSDPGQRADRRISHTRFEADGDNPFRNTPSGQPQALLPGRHPDLAVQMRDEAGDRLRSRLEVVSSGGRRCCQRIGKLRGIQVRGEARQCAFSLTASSASTMARVRAGSSGGAPGRSAPVLGPLRHRWRRLLPGRDRAGRGTGRGPAHAKPLHGCFGRLQKLPRAAHPSSARVRADPSRCRARLTSANRRDCGSSVMLAEFSATRPGTGMWA